MIAIKTESQQLVDILVQLGFTKQDSCFTHDFAKGEISLRWFDDTVVHTIKGKGRSAVSIGDRCILECIEHFQQKLNKKIDKKLKKTNAKKELIKQLIAEVLAEI
jgi:hypothetical protein